MNVKAIMQYLGKCRREISELANVRGEKPSLIGLIIFGVQ